MKLQYKQKLFLYFAIVFAVFSMSIFFFVEAREKKFRIEILEEKLDTYTEIIQTNLTSSIPNGFSKLDSLLHLFPSDLRLSIIDNQGTVLFDNEIHDISTLENHSSREEIIEAYENKKGRHIRTSQSNQQSYLYYAKKYENQYIRVALPYDSKTKLLLQSDYIFFTFMFLFFIICLIALYYITNKFGKSIQQLRDFALDKTTNTTYLFPDDELGEIGSQITKNYNQLKESEKRTALERERLLQHIQISEEGICFFSSEKKVEFYNSLFIQHLNFISSESSSNPQQILSDQSFLKIQDFLSDPDSNYFELLIHKQKKAFTLRINIFEDKSFEIILNDITQQEKTRKLKQEMTSNIAHELRTPLTSIRGYLETALNLKLKENKKNYLIQQAYELSLLLSNLVQDMGLITSLEEAPETYELEEVDFNALLWKVKNDLSLGLIEKKIDLQWYIPNELKLKANYNLLYSIFKNLTDNTIRYAGTSIKVRIHLYHEDDHFYFFSFYDTGKGIPDDQHLNRLFERFYRINEGRTRDTGGTGLGLSIVKNAIAFHHGKITVKKHLSGGLEFLFQLRKI